MQARQGCTEAQEGQGEQEGGVEDAWHHRPPQVAASVT